MNARDVNFFKGNYSLSQATNFYSYKLKEEPRATGNADAIYVFATITVEYDSPSSNTKLARKRSDVKMKYEKVGNDFVYLFSMRSQSDGEFISEMDFGSKESRTSITFNAGVMYMGTPKVSRSATGMLAPSFKGADSLEEVLNKHVYLRFLPVISFRLNLKFKPKKISTENW